MQRTTINVPRTTIHVPRTTIHVPRTTIHVPRTTIHVFLAALLLAMAFASVAAGQAPVNCVVLDPELQGSYVGGCKEGLAEGYGEAIGAAEYKGGFRAGRKHGKGTKMWRSSGDRYEGDFSADRKEGVGTYTWGPRSASPGEKYSGGFLNDRREGSGVYEWPSGDRYAGTWKNDVITGRPTPQMFDRARAYGELAAAVGIPETKVCREMTVGIGTRDWVRGTVLTVEADKIVVRIDDAGRFQHMIANVPIGKGGIVRDAPRFWTPCIKGSDW